MQKASSTDGGSFTLGKAIEDFLTFFSVKVREGVRSRATLDHHRENAGYLCERIPPTTPLAELTAILIDSLAVLEQQGRTVGTDGRRRPICNGTLAKRLSTLRQVMKLARRRGHIERVPEFPSIERRYRPRTEHLRGPDELAELVAGLPEDHGDWVYVAVFSGQRPASIHAMRVRDCDPYARPPWMVIRSHKTGDTEGQLVVMPAPLARRLRKRLERRKLGPHDPIVDHWAKDPRCRALRPLAERLGLPSLRASDLRRTFGSWVAHQQRTLTVGLMRWMGHTDFGMLSRVYARALPPAFGEVADAVTRAARAPRRSPQMIRPAGNEALGKTKPRRPPASSLRGRNPSPESLYPPLGRRKV